MSRLQLLAIMATLLESDRERYRSFADAASDAASLLRECEKVDREITRSPVDTLRQRHDNALLNLGAFVFGMESGEPGAVLMCKREETRDQFVELMHQAIETAQRLSLRVGP